MVRIVTDNDFNGRILRGLLRQRPGLDVVRSQDLGMAALPDPDLLAWAAANGRVVATRDRNTMVGFALSRVAAGESMAGVFVVDSTAPIARVIDTLLLIDDQSETDEWADRVEFLPW